MAGITIFEVAGLGIQNSIDDRHKLGGVIIRTEQILTF